jgi:hypothetical protein
MANKPTSSLATVWPLGTKRPTSPPPPRKKMFPPVTLIGVEAAAVGQIVDQLEDTIRVLLGQLWDMPHTSVTRKDIESAIADAEKICEKSRVDNTRKQN